MNLFQQLFAQVSKGRSKGYISDTSQTRSGYDAVGCAV